MAMRSDAEGMSRLGQGDLGLRTHWVGTVWVRSVSAELAFYPRLVLNAGCQLQEAPARPPLGSRSCRARAPQAIPGHPDPSDAFCSSPATLSMLLGTCRRQGLASADPRISRARDSWPITFLATFLARGIGAARGPPQAPHVGSGRALGDKDACARARQPLSLPGSRRRSGSRVSLRTFQ